MREIEPDVSSHVSKTRVFNLAATIARPPNVGVVASISEGSAASGLSTQPPALSPTVRPDLSGVSSGDLDALEMVRQREAKDVVKAAR